MWDITCIWPFTGQQRWQVAQCVDRGLSSQNIQWNKLKFSRRKTVRKMNGLIYDGRWKMCNNRVKVDIWKDEDTLWFIKTQKICWFKHNELIPESSLLISIINDWRPNLYNQFYHFKKILSIYNHDFYNFIRDR